MTIAAVPNMNMDFIEYASEIGRIHGRIHEIRHELYSVHGGDCRVIGFYISGQPDDISAILPQMRGNLQKLWRMPSSAPVELPPAASPVVPPLRLKLRSEEHTSELQSQSNLVCRLLLEKKKKKQT